MSGGVTGDGLRAAATLAAEYLRGVDDRPVWRPMPTSDRAWFTDQPLPPTARPWSDLLDDVRGHVLPYPMGNGHRRFFGWVNSAPSPAGVAVAPLAAALNPSCAGGDHAGVLLERTVVRWLAELVGYPVVPGGGLLTSGASTATIVAVAAARGHAARRSGVDVRTDGLAGLPPFVVYTSDEGHSCVTKAAELVGIGSRRVRRIPTGAECRLRVDLLADAIARDLADGRVPCAVVANAGTVNTGAVDDLAAVAELTSARHVWLHVDGAYGALAAADPDRRAQFAGMERADSLALDAHKWLGVPVDCGTLLFRDPAAVRDAFSLVPAYLRDPGADDLGWLSEYGTEQTRPFRALPAWATIAALGRAGVVDLVRRTCATARTFACLVGDADDLVLLAPVATSIVVFRHQPRGASPDDVDALNAALPTLLQHGGAVFLTGTTVGGRPALRACFLNPTTTDDDLRILLDEVHTAGRSLSGR